jgi:hypothetical protein
VAIVDPRIGDALDRRLLQRILLGQVTAWADGSPIVIVIATDGDSRAALEQVAGRDLDRLLRGWKRLIFTGSGAMPTLVDSAQQALAQVARRPGALAVLASVPADAASQQVRAVTPVK